MAKNTKIKKIIIGNWKMNPQDSIKAKEIFTSIRKTARTLTKIKTVICPPFVYISELRKLVNTDRIAVGAQNAFYENEGSYTGEVSPSILKNCGVAHIIIGHSERRAKGETNEIVNKKVLKVIGEKMTVVLCIGEKERDHAGEYLNFLKAQIKESLNGISKKELNNIIIAYEPVWAIGKSDKEAPQPADIYEMTIYIRKVLSDMFGSDVASMVPVLYGGSVTSKISLGILKDGKVDGLLIGRQSLDPQDFSITLKQANDL